MNTKIITRKAAIEQGLNKYYTGRPCKRGHLSERYTVCSSCVTCSADRVYRSRNSVRELLRHAS